MNKKRFKCECTSGETELDATPVPVRTVSTQDLLGSADTLHIQHGDEVYTLRITRNNRLILTK